MVDDRRTNLLQDAFDQIACLTGVSLSENRPVNPSSSAPASNSVNMELSRRFPSLRMPAAATGSAASLAGPATMSAPGNSASRSTLSRSSSTRNQGTQKRKRTADKSSKVVYKDLVFIPDPDKEQGPTHNARVMLETEGKVIHGFPVDAEWDARTTV